MATEGMLDASLAAEFPRQYAVGDGGLFHPRHRGTELPIPPAWVVERANVPAVGTYATLATPVMRGFPADAVRVLRDYVREWDGIVAEYAAHLVIGGEESHKQRLFAASAVVNEIVMRYSHTTSLQTAFFRPGSLRSLLDAKQNRGDSGNYHHLRNLFLNAHLLIVHEPEAMMATYEERQTVEWIYEHRQDRRLPTITSLALPVSESMTSLRRGMASRLVREILTEEHYGFVCTL